MRTRVIESIYYILKAADIISKINPEINRKLRRISKEILEIELDQNNDVNFYCNERREDKNVNLKNSKDIDDIDSKVNEYLEKIRSRILQGETKRSIFSEED